MTPKPWDARLAAWLVTPLIRSRHVVPNHLTALRLVVGLAGAALFATGRHPNAAALLIVVSNFLDHTDGELARLGGKSSRLGHCFDLASDALVTVCLFVGVGVGLAHGPLGGAAVVMGAVAGAAVALIFHLRNLIENRHGKDATRQPHLGGFEAEDVLYLLPLVTLADGLTGFLWASVIGAPVAALVVVWQYCRLLRAPPGQTP